MDFSREKSEKISVKQQSLSSYINYGNEMVSQIPLNLQITKKRKLIQIKARMIKIRTNYYIIIIIHWTPIMLEPTEADLKHK